MGMNGKRMLITGASGFIGSAIAQEAVKQGFDVTGTGRTGEPVDGIRIVKADIRDKGAMLRLTRGIDYVIHLAAITSSVEFERRMPFAYDVNVNGFNSVIEAAYTNGCEKFLYASSSAVYGNDFSESAKMDMGDGATPYAKTKLMNEMVAKSYSISKLLETVGMRFFNVYGPGENRKENNRSIVSIFLEDRAAHRPLVIYGDGKQSRDLIYVTDVAKIALKFLKKSPDSLYNVGTGKATSYNEIADMIDKKNKKYMPNKLSTYQTMTRADTTRLLKCIGVYDFVEVKEGIRKMLKLQPEQ
jgi:UDP-glucose 4-epimerase